MLKKNVISFIYIFLIQFIFSCSICNCPEPKSFSFDFDKLLYEKIIQKTSEANEIAFSIILKDSSQILVSNKKSKGSFIPVAIACSCRSSIYGVLKSPIKNLNIYSYYDLNNNYKAGSDVSELFVGSATFYENTSRLYDKLNTTKTNLNNLNYYVGDLKPLEKVQKKVSFFMRVKPLVTKSKFKVKVEFENGQILETETEEFIQK